MSFDIFIQRFEGGNAAPIARGIFEREFGPFVINRSAGFREAAYEDGGTADIYLEEEGDLDGLMISRPPKSEAFWTSVFNVLRDTGGVLYWPGDKPAAVVATASAIAHLPADFIEALGTPVVVKSGTDITNCISAS